MSIAEKLQTIAENELKVYEAGKAHGETVGRKAQYDEFWDNYQNYGNKDNYSQSFYGSGWTDITYNPKYPIICGEGVKSWNMLAYSRITDTKVVIDVSKSTADATFNSCQYLVTIRKLISGESTKYSAFFNYCYALENLTIEGVIGSAINLQWSTKLSKASITSVMNALSTTTSGLSITLSMAAVNKAFETSSGANDGASSTEFAEIALPKSNWTILLI